MIKDVNFWDKVMFGALLILVIFIPYSSVVIEGCILIMLIAWFVKRSLLWRIQPQRSFWSVYTFPSQGFKWPLIILGILILATTPFAIEPTLSLKKFFSRFLQQIFLMYAVIEVVNSKKRLFLVMVMLLWTMIVVNADAVFQYFSGASFIFSNHMFLERVNGPLRHPNDLGTLLVTLLPIFFVLLLSRTYWIPVLFGNKFKGIATVVLGMLFIFSVVSLGLTTSRGAWVAFALTSVGLGVFLKRYKLTLVIAAFLLVFFWIFGTHCVNLRLDIAPTGQSSTGQTWTAKEKSELKQEYATKVLLNASGRQTYWNTAINVIKHYPIFGCGYNCYIQALRKSHVGHEEYPHNVILHIAAEMGFIGLAIYLWLFLLIFWRGLNIVNSMKDHMHTIASGIYFGVLAWFLHSQMDTPWESLQLSFLWWLMLGIMFSLPAAAQNTVRKGV